MNPDQNRNGITVQTLMLVGLFVSAAVTVIAIALVDLIALQVKSQTFFLLAVGLVVVVLIVLIITNYLMQRGIRNRFNALADVCQEYAAGDRTIRAFINGDDDFAKLALSLNALLDSQGSVSASPLTGGAIGNEAAALQAQIEKLLQEVSAVGDGDLRVQAEVTPDTLGVLADSFNYMIEELAKVVGRVQSTAVQVTNATRRILDRSAELAQASDTQVKQIAQTTEAVEALAVFIQTVARNAQMSVEAAQDALRNAAIGQQAVRQTIEGMMVIRENVQETAKKIKRLGERSNEIGEIVRIIEDIADQTNLLALNAAIQSAMAGEHGRGFAVVADEIRLLAERSTESTKRIATLVKSIQGDTYEAVVAMEDSTQEVVKGSQLADDAGRSLNSIYGAVERQAQMIENIARAANEQTSVSEAVAVAMGRISEITRQTDAGTQEAAVSVSYLAELSEQLRASVSTFRLPDRANDLLGSFSNMSSVTELPDNGSFVPSLGSGTDQNWGQNFSASFPPLPEPGNTGSLIPMTARSGQYGTNNQQDFERAGAFSGSAQGNNSQQFFGNQLDFGELPSFDSQAPAGFNSGFADQQYGQAPAGFNPGFADQQYGQQYGQAPAGFNPGFADQQYGQQYGQAPAGFNSGFADQQYGQPPAGFNSGFADQQYGQQYGQPPAGSAGTNQPFYQGSNPNLASPNPALVSTPQPAQPNAGQGIPARPRWQPNGAQQDQRR